MCNPPACLCQVQEQEKAGSPQGKITLWLLLDSGWIVTSHIFSLFGLPGNPCVLCDGNICFGVVMYAPVPVPHHLAGITQGKNPCGLPMLTGCGGIGVQYCWCTASRTRWILNWPNVALLLQRKPSSSTAVAPPVLAVEEQAAAAASSAAEAPAQRRVRWAEGDALARVLVFEVCKSTAMHDCLLAAVAACPHATKAHPIHFQWSRLPWSARHWVGAGNSNAFGSL